MKTLKFSLLGLLFILASAEHKLHSQSNTPFRLDISRTNSNAVLTWTNSGVALERSLVLTGSWIELTGAVSPKLVSPTNPMEFFRLRAASVAPSGFEFRYVAPTFTTSIGDPFGCGCTSPENPNSLAAGGGVQDNGMGSMLLHTGELTQDAVDLEIPGRGFNWRFERRYRSGMSYDGPLGYGWDFNYNRRLAVETNGNVLCMNGMGRANRYTSNTNSTFNSPAGFYTQLTRNLDGTFVERDRHGTTNFYSATNLLGIARLNRISDRNANQMIFQYNTVGQLTNVVDTLTRSIAYRYDANGRLTNVTDFAGRALGFAYDVDGNLASATSPAVTGTTNGNDFPAGKTTVYTYATGQADPRFNHNLLSVTAPNETSTNGLARLMAQYDMTSLSTNADRVVSLALAGTNLTGVAAGGTISYTYASFGSVSSNDYATVIFLNTVTNRNGDVTEYGFNQLGNIVRSIQFTRGLRVGEPAGYTNTFAFNANGEMVARTNPELDSIEYTFDSANPNRLQQGNLLQTRWLPGPRGGDQAEIIVSMTYTTNFNFVATSTDARSNTTSFTYDARGNRTHITHALPSIVEDFTYNAFGQLISHTLPDNGSGYRRRDAMTYYSSGPQKGYLQSSSVDATNLNLTTTYEYDPAGNTKRMIDPMGNDTLYTYNALNQLVHQSSRAVSTPSGLVRYEKTLFYDANNNVTRIDVQNRDETGAVVSANPSFTTTYTYDIFNQRLTTTQEVDATNNLVTAYVYDANGNSVLTRFGEAVAGWQSNNVVQTIYDERNLLFRIIRAPGDPSQSTDQYDYDGNGNQIRTSQGIENSPRITVAAYDGYNRQVTQTDAMGNININHFDGSGNTISNRVNGELNDVAGNSSNVRLGETTFTYDAMNRLVQTDRAFFDVNGAAIGSGHATNLTVYSGTSQVLQSFDANGHVSSASYNTANLIANQLDHGSNRVDFAYNANSQVITTTEVDKSDLGSPDQTFVTQKTYDNLDRLVQTVDNIGNTNRHAYDSRNNRLMSTDGRDNRTHYAYDGLSRLISTTRDLTDNGLGSGTVTNTIVTTQSWDDSSRLTGQTDANSNTTTYVYDALNRMSATIFADGTSNTFVLDVHDNTVTDTDANGNVVTATYDLLDRVTAKSIARGPGISGTTFENYQYDGLSRIGRAENNDSIVTRSHDSFGGITTEIQHSISGTPQTISRTYDTEGNMLTLGYPGGRVVYTTYDALDRKATINDSSTMSASYSYFGTGRVERRDYGNNTRAIFAYDGIRRLTNSLHSSLINSLVVESREYAWDAAHNKTAANDLLAPTLDSRSFNYDSFGRLIQSVTANVGPTVAYALDGVGNRLNVTGGTNAGNYSLSSSTPPADHQMNQYTTTPFDSRAYDANGNLTNAGPTVSVYDYSDRLMAVTRYDGISSYTNVLSAKYDCFGRRIEKAVTGVVTRYYYADWQEIEEQNSGNSTIATYVWGNGIDELLNMNRLGQTYYYHADDQGSIRKVTLSSPAIAEQYRYDDYGEPHFFDTIGNELAGSQFGNATLYTGRRFDPETDLYYYRTRHLDTAAGRFTTRDSIGIWGDEASFGNGYLLVANNPVTLMDPMGTSCKDKCGIKHPFRDKKKYACYDDCDDKKAAAEATSVANRGGNKQKCYNNCFIKHPLDETKRMVCIKECGIEKAEHAVILCKDWCDFQAVGSLGVKVSHWKIKRTFKRKECRADCEKLREFFEERIEAANAASFDTSQSNQKDNACRTITGTPHVPILPALSIRMLTSQRELTEKEHHISQGVLKARRP